VLWFAQLTTLGGISASAFSAAAPSAADLAHCASIADPATRLACYDALNGKAAGKPSVQTPTSAAIAETSPPAAGSAFSSDPQNFGFTEAQRAPAQAQAEPKAINARVAKIDENTYGRAVAVLDNGQTWLFIDGEQDAHLRPQDPITIRRGALGSFLLITPSHHSYHVKRTQ